MTFLVLAAVVSAAVANISLVFVVADRLSEPKFASTLPTGPALAA